MSTAAERYVTCRVLGHAWDEIGDSDWRHAPNRIFRYRLVCRCERCGTHRFDGIGAYGQVERRYYTYPEGYAYAAIERPSRDELRLIMIGGRRRRRGAA